MAEEIHFTDLIINQIIQTKKFISERNVLCLARKSVKLDWKVKSMW